MQQPRIFTLITSLALLATGCGKDTQTAGAPWDFKEGGGFPAEPPDKDMGDDSPEEMGDPPPEDMAIAPDMTPAPGDMAPVVEDMEDVEPPPLPDCSTPPPAHEFDATARHTVQAAIALGPTGCPHVAYLQRPDLQGRFSAKYAYWDGSRWNEEAVPFEDTNYHIDITIDASGKVNLVLGPQDRPEIVWMQRQFDGTWSRQVILNEWPWHLTLASAEDGRLVLLAYTADERSTGTNMVARHLVLDGGQWRGGVINEDKPIMLHARPELQLTSGDGVLVPILQNKGYGPNDQVPNLWLAQGTLSSPEVWLHERIEADGVVDTRNAYATKIGQTTHILTLARDFPISSNNPTLQHITNRDGAWVSEVLPSCANRRCSAFSVQPDDAGRLHALLGWDDATSNTRTTLLVHGIYEDGAWDFRELDEFQAWKTRVRWDAGRGVPHILTFLPAEPEDDEESAKLTYFALEDR